MGLLVDGVWRDQWYDTKDSGGRFQRPQTQFRNWITPDGSAGPTGRGGFKAEPGRYHLYAAYFCPWAHRTLIFRLLKGLDAMIGVSILSWQMLEDGLSFAPAPGGDADPINRAQFLHQVYTAADPNYSGRVSVPVLWDKETATVVCNESADIIRMLNSAFDGVGARPGDYYPADLRPEIDALNARIYDSVNNGVYKCGFATSQAAYNEAVGPLFDTLDVLDDRLGHSRYLCGEHITEADIRLLTTLLRFDIVYVGHFKCNVRRIADYPNLSGYLHDLYQTDRIAETFDAFHCKHHYYESHRMINPSGIVPAGPDLDLTAPHGRG